MTSIGPPLKFHELWGNLATRPADPVWVYRGGTWRAGVVEAVSARAATVTYRPSSARGTGVDTLTAQYMLPRADLDPVLDQDGQGLSTR